LKNWACVQVNHHNDVGSKIEEWERKKGMAGTYTPILALNSGEAQSITTYSLR
jgi:hypothetical protein